jgi:outer membrane lipoprotein
MPIFQPFPRGVVKLGFELIRPNEERGHKGILSLPKPEEKDKEKLKRGKGLKKKKEMTWMEIGYHEKMKGSFCIFIFSIILSSILILSGCASVIPDEMKRQARKDLIFEAILSDPERFKGEKVIVGGIIVDTVVKRNHIVIEVLQKPLGFRDRPKNTDISGGRFLVQLEGYKDPEIYHKGREITVFGEIMGRRVQKMGEMDYSYPLIKGEEVYLWRRDEFIIPRLHFGLGIYRGF